jgi:serine/threonine-protein kinase
VDEPPAAHAIIATTANETDPRLSPDGKWLAYISDESTRDEVYVQEYPSGRRWQISTGGASSPYWSHDGSELFYVSNAANVMAVGVSGGVEPEMGAPQELFSIRSGNLWGVAPDGRFLVSTPVEDPIDAPLTVVLDWTAALDVR